MASVVCFHITFLARPQLQSSWHCWYDKFLDIPYTESPERLEQFTRLELETHWQTSRAWHGIKKYPSFLSPKRLRRWKALGFFGGLDVFGFDVPKTHDAIGSKDATK